MSKRKKAKRALPVEPVEPVGWIANHERLLCLLVLADRYAGQLSSLAGDAFFRAFVVQDRKSGDVSVKFRYRYCNGKDSWFHIGKPKEPMSPSEVVADLTLKLETTLRLGAERMGVLLPPDAIIRFDPPDDEGDPFRTIQWLQAMDLIHTPRYVELGAVQ